MSEISDKLASLKDLKRQMGQWKKQDLKKKKGIKQEPKKKSQEQDEEDQDQSSDSRLKQLIKKIVGE